MGLFELMLNFFLFVKQLIFLSYIRQNKKSMRNLILTFIAFSCLFFSCKDAEETKITFEEQIVSDWGINSFVINCDDASQSVPMTVADESGCVDMFGVPNCITISLLANGLGEVRYDPDGNDTDMQMATYELNEENSTVSVCFEQGSCTLFNFVDDQLYYNEDEYDCVCTFGFAK